MPHGLRMFDANERPKGDNPTIGLILCSDKNETIATYSVLADGRRIFAAEYVKVLPSEKALAAHVEHERRLIEERNTVSDYARSPCSRCKRQS